MAKYLNKSARVHIVGGKVLIPLAEAVELTDEELKSSVLQAYIAKGDLVKVDEPDTNEENGNIIVNEQIGAKAVTISAATVNITGETVFDPPIDPTESKKRRNQR